jgi:hypothetical protein
MKVYLVNYHLLNLKCNTLISANDNENDSEYSLETDGPHNGEVSGGPRIRRISSRLKTIDKDEKLKVRLELEFEAIDNSR